MERIYIENRFYCNFVTTECVNKYDHLHFCFSAALFIAHLKPSTETPMTETIYKTLIFSSADPIDGMLGSVDGKRNAFFEAAQVRATAQRIFGVTDVEGKDWVIQRGLRDDDFNPGHIARCEGSQGGLTYFQVQIKDEAVDKLLNLRSAGARGAIGLICAPEDLKEIREGKQLREHFDTVAVRHKGKLVTQSIERHHESVERLVNEKFGIADDEFDRKTHRSHLVTSSGGMNYYEIRISGKAFERVVQQKHEDFDVTVPRGGIMPEKEKFVPMKRPEPKFEKRKKMG
jgi:hypothetical protein